MSPHPNETEPRSKRPHKVHNASRIAKRTPCPKVLPYELVLNDICKTPLPSSEGQQQLDKGNPPKFQTVPEMHYVWLIDRDDQKIHVVPPACEKQLDAQPCKPSDKTAKQNSNCFMIYRRWARRALPGNQVEVSKEIGVLWRSESAEMKRLCEQIAAMKACNYPL